jgi:hypothetical protein
VAFPARSSLLAQGKGGIECDWLVVFGDHAGGMYAVQRRVVLVNRGQVKSYFEMLAASWKLASSMAQGGLGFQNICND